METYTTIDSETIIITTTTPLTDADGNAVVDGDGNPVNSITQAVMTLDQATNQAQLDASQLGIDQQKLTDATAKLQAIVDADNAVVAVDNARLAAFAQPISPTPPYQIMKPVTPFVPADPAIPTDDATSTPTQL